MSGGKAADLRPPAAAGKHAPPDGAELETMFLSALGHLAQDEPQAAADLLLRVRNAHDRIWAPQAAFEYALVLGQLDEPARMREALAQADRLAGPSRNPLVKVNVGLQWQRLGDLTRATNSYAAVVGALVSTKRQLDEPDMRALALACYRRGQIAFQEENIARAEQYWRQSLSFGHEEVSPYAALDLADMLDGKLHPAEVEELLRVAIDFDHWDVSPRAGLRLGRFLADRWQLDAAERLYLEVIDSQHPQAVEHARTHLEKLYADRRALAKSCTEPRNTPEPGRQPGHKDVARVLIIGAGTGGQYLRDELREDQYEVVGFIDDDATRLHAAEHLRVLGTIDELSQLLSTVEVDEVHMAIPTAPGNTRARVVRACREARVTLLNLPTMYELCPNRPLLPQLRPVRVHETVGSAPCYVDREAASWLRGHSVMVTGAGGALGSEVARRLAQARVRHLVLVDQASRALSAISSELTSQRDFTAGFPVLADCSNQNNIDHLIKLHEVNVIVHAATHGDAQTVDSAPIEAAANGPIMLDRMLRAAGQRSVALFVHASCHEAGDGSLYGATARACERAVTAAAAEFVDTTFLAVRLGATIDGQDSPPQTWERQLDSGGPVEIPCPSQRHMVRQHRNAELLLHAARLGKSGEVLATCTGEDVDLEALAREAIAMAGRERSGVPVHRQAGTSTGDYPAAEPHPDHAELVRICDEDELGPHSLQKLTKPLREAASQGNFVLLERLLRQKPCMATTAAGPRP